MAVVKWNVSAYRILNEYEFGSFGVTFSSTRKKYYFYTYKIIFLRVGVNTP